MHNESTRHYDQEVGFFSQFLDPTMKYTSGLYTTGEESLEDAALAMLDHLITIGSLRSNARVLEVGYGWGSLLGRLLLGQLLRRDGQFEQAEQALLDATYLAEAGREDETLVLARIELGWLEGYDHSRIDAGLRWYRGAAAVLERMDARDDLTGLRLHSEGMLLKLDGRYDEAMQRVEAGLVALRRANEPDLLAAATDTAANILDLQGHYVEALARHQESLQLRMNLYGADHPNTTTSLGNIAIVLDELGRHVESVQTGLRVAELRERAYGPDHLDVAMALANVGIALMHQHRHDEAITTLERVLRIRERVYGPDHAGVAGVCGNLGDAYRLAGRLDEAERLTRRGLELHIRHFGPDNPRTLIARSQLGDSLLAAGRLDEAAAEFREVLVMHERVLGSDHPRTGESLINLAEVELELGHTAEAVMLLERANRILTVSPSAPATTAHGQFLLARALFEVGGDDARVVELAEDARATFLELAASQGREPDELVDIDALLAHARTAKHP